MDRTKTEESFLRAGEVSLNESWLHGKYSCGEINTSLITVEVFDSEEDGFFAQGEHAWEIILEIHQIWNGSGLTQEQAFQQWIFQNL